jgi:hypothetical protein
MACVGVLVQYTDDQHCCHVDDLSYNLETNARSEMLHDFSNASMYKSIQDMCAIIVARSGKSAAWSMKFHVLDTSRSVTNIQHL